MIEEMLMGVAGALLGGGLTRYFSTAKAQLQEADRVVDDTPALVKVAPLVRRVRQKEYVCADGTHYRAREGEVLFDAPPPGVRYVAMTEVIA